MLALLDEPGLERDDALGALDRWPMAWLLLGAGWWWETGSVRPLGSSNIRVSRILMPKFGDQSAFPNKLSSSLPARMRTGRRRLPGRASRQAVTA
jgi:hypothetical protein